VLEDAGASRQQLDPEDVLAPELPDSAVLMEQDDRVLSSKSGLFGVATVLVLTRATANSSSCPM
jgi:hypothetical protein